ncbi:Transmembrane domain-containing protein [Spironucleus salmonicida]|uniref:Transmembrane domain-containing protein n=1 Tax=Spironucleus salmonicida TaxID=348837 RepID=A0A9P8LLK6_9EUKA|nr:Transmembrane domain-containing protein [Spironucleus salmonicida]
MIPLDPQNYLLQLILILLTTCINAFFSGYFIYSMHTLNSIFSIIFLNLADIVSLLISSSKYCISKQISTPLLGTQRGITKIQKLYNFEEIFILIAACFLIVNQNQIYITIPIFILSSLLVFKQRFSFILIQLSSLSIILISYFLYQSWQVIIICCLACVSISLKINFNTQIQIKTHKNSRLQLYTPKSRFGKEDLSTLINIFAKGLILVKMFVE